MIKIAFASGRDEQNRELIARMDALYPELPLYVVSEFPPDRGVWVRYHVARSFAENFARCRAAFAGKRIRLAGVLLVPAVPYRRMRLIPLLLAPWAFLAWNENFDNFMLRPASLATIARHLLWRVKNFLRWQVHPGGHVYTFFWRSRRPRRWRVPLLYRAALWSRWTRLHRPLPAAAPQDGVPEGISVVIPSRNGRDLLAAQLTGILDDLRGIRSEVIVVDNGSCDGTAEFLAHCYSDVIVETSAGPLSFARAVNRGISRARFSHICLLNNDMIVEPGFFAALRQPFREISGLFCSTAQILFPESLRREETGKAVFRQEDRVSFPVRCDDPIPGEDGTYVLYGSGGCSLYSTAKLRAIGGIQEMYEPAYVEDLDAGFRAWQRGWPTVFAANARVLHRHRATTSRYYTEQQLTAILEVNYLRFLASAIASDRLFRELWRKAILRARVIEAVPALEYAWKTKFEPRGGYAEVDERSILAIGGGDVAVFPGRAPRGLKKVLIASPYVPFPLSHGGAVRMYNLMRRAAADFDQVLVAFADRLETPPAELLDIFNEVVLVRRKGSHSLPATRRPEVVEEFDSPAFHAALRLTIRKHAPAIAQLEFTQMAQYAADCAPAKTILVEHDITFDLWQQLVSLNGGWEERRQLARWEEFERAAWRDVDVVVTMSRQDRERVTSARAESLPNGVDLERFRPAPEDPDPRRLLFIGSFAHRPNVLALEFFLNEVQPQLGDVKLHVIAGARHESFPVEADLRGVELEGFVADVRPAYRHATVVIAPLVASAGTNIKIMEAMAMGKAIVSTPQGINGLDLSDEILLARSAPEMARAIEALLADPAQRRVLQGRARARVERDFDWDAIARRQRALYRSMLY